MPSWSSTVVVGEILDPEYDTGRDGGGTSAGSRAIAASASRSIAAASGAKV